MNPTSGTIGPLERLNSFINQSPTIYEKAGAEIKAPAHKAVMYDAGGDVVIATDASRAIGVILSSSPDPIAAGAPVHVLVKDIGLLEAGGAIDKGDFVTINAAGQGVKAASGSFIFGRALTAPKEAGEAVQVQINPMGRMA